MLNGLYLAKLADRLICFFATCCNASKVIMANEFDVNEIEFDTMHQYRTKEEPKKFVFTHSVDRSVQLPKVVDAIRSRAKPEDP